MQTITTTAQYNSAQKALYLDHDVPDIVDTSYKVFLRLIPLDRVESQIGIKEELDKTYGLLAHLPEGVSFVRKIRDQADKRVRSLWK